MYLINGAHPHLIYTLREGKRAGTLFTAKEQK